MFENYEHLYDIYKLIVWLGVDGVCAKKKFHILIFLEYIERCVTKFIKNMKN